MADKIVRPERRRLERRRDRLGALGAAVEESAWSDRRTHCWNLEPTCGESQRKRCSAHFVQRNCWDLWAAEYFPAGRKPCCHSSLDCSDCQVAAAKFSGPIPIYVEIPSRSKADQPSSAAKGGSSGYCRFLYSTKEAVVGRVDGERLSFRCQRRRGIALDSAYVSEVCASLEHRECTFFDNE